MVQPSDPIAFHRHAHGKVAMVSTLTLTSDNLSIVYTPGVGEVSRVIAEDRSTVRDLTGKQNMVAIVTDGSAVLGLGDIGPEAALPVMEGKAAIFSEFAGVSAVPICLDTKDPQAIVDTVRYLAPGFGGINLEDISAPRCFEIERRLTAELDIPVFHDDQHGTAIVVLAGLINALKVTGKGSDVRIAISGAGAAGLAIAHLLVAYGMTCIRISDSKGVLTSGRENINPDQREVLALSSAGQTWKQGRTVLDGADVFIGVSKAGLFNAEDIGRMRSEPVVFALANPVPEIMPDEARAGGAAVVATGRSDFPNQINNALVFPGLFRGLLDHRVSHVTTAVKLAAARALATLIEDPSPDRIVPSIFDERVVPAIADAVGRAEG
ncbi:MAG TPA: NADP-dependent malic enzyme [Actinobacteria bacterium]|nr:NADP-dependent malic enzyme [Actinomycetota bacterium]